ncbi:MAG: sugar kinase [Deltaproteobacteria bacterium]|nr:sugar kinase [Deltaproteobacteria bacterium]MBW2307248.1 sugar kinase [Deltaproteobacteria bacterium]
MARSIDVVTIGELLYVLRAPHQGTLERTKMLECLSGGAEGNVVIGLSRLGLQTAFVSKVRDNFIGRTLVDDLKSFDVDTRCIILDDTGRMGIMFVELGSPPRPNNIVYDREGASITHLKPEEVDWAYFRSAKNFYFSGISPALGENCRQTLLKAVHEAKAAKMKIFYDVNFRSKLWSYSEARRFLMTIIDDIDVLFIQLSDAEKMFQTRGQPGEKARELKRRLGVNTLVLTLGPEGAAVAGDVELFKKAFPTQPTNRLGVGDSFVAGFMYGYLKGDVESALEYGTAMAAIKSTIPNENRPLITKKQVEDLIASQDAENILRNSSHSIIR